MFPIASNGQGPFSFWHKSGTCERAEEVAVVMIEFSPNDADLFEDMKRNQ